MYQIRMITNGQEITIYNNPIVIQDKVINLILDLLSKERKCVGITLEISKDQNKCWSVYDPTTGLFSEYKGDLSIITYAIDNMVFELNCLVYSKNVNSITYNTNSPLRVITPLQEKDIVAMLDDTILTTCGQSYPLGKYPIRSPVPIYKD